MSQIVPQFALDDKRPVTATLAEPMSDEFPLPQFVLRASTKIPPDEQIAKFRTLRVHKIRCWESLLACPAFVLAAAEQIRSQGDERLLGELAATMTACRSLAVRIPKRHIRARRIVGEEAIRLAPLFAAWDQDHEFFETWRRELASSTDPRVHEHLERAREHTRAYAKQHGELVVANLRLVVSTVKRCIYRLSSPEDLGSEGAIGLLKAVHRFDPERGLRFATYGVYWIRHFIMRKQQNDDLVRLPVHLQEKSHRLNRARRRYIAENGVEPSAKELLALANIPGKPTIVEKEIHMLDRRSSTMFSLGHLVGIFEDDDSTLQDVLPDRSESIEYTIATAELRAIVDQSLATMAPAQADAFRQAAGIFEGETLQSIGARHGLSRERIRQLSLEAADQICRTLRRRRPYFNLGKGGGVGVGTGGGRAIGGP